jgi:hypothetical protein
MVIGCNPDDEILQKRFQNMDESADDPTELFSDDMVNKELDPFGGKEICGQVIEKSLLSHGNFIGGSLFIANTEDKLFFKFIPVEGWLISEVNLYIGNLEDIPASQSGNPQYSEFLNTQIYDPPLPEVSVPINLSDIEIEDDGSITIVAHTKIINNNEEVSVVKSVLAEWDDDLLFLGPRRGGGFYYEIQSCDIDPEASALNEDPASGLEDEVTVFNYCGVEPAELKLKNKKNDPTQVEILGTVYLSTDEENMNFDFSVVEDWKIESIHVNVGEFDQDQYNPAGTVPIGKYDFGESYVPAMAATIEIPYPFDVPLVEMVEELDNSDCAIFYIVANLTREIIQDDIVITESQAVSVAWSNDLSASSRQRGGSISGGSQGGSTPGGGSQGSGSPSQGSVEPASINLCLQPCADE